MLEKFAAFPVIQVIDLDAAIGTGANEDIVEWISARARIRVGAVFVLLKRLRRWWTSAWRR